MNAQGHTLVFVGGLHRSGTTLVARLLAAHPQVSGFSGTDAKEDEGQHLQTVYPPARAHGGAARFAFSPGAHLTEDSDLVSVEAADLLFEQWRAHWDLSRPVLVEKSPPNLVMTRFLQALYPDARFVIVVRHPAIVALSTSKWSFGTPMRRLLEHWLRAHEIFMADVGKLRQVHVLKYEDLTRDPEPALAAVAAFLGLEGPIPPESLQTHRSSEYERRWSELATGGLPWRRRAFRRMCDQLEPRVREFGYSLVDLRRVEELAIGPEEGSTRRVP